MTRIVAIEPNPERGALLERLVHDSIGAAVTLVTSTTTALAAIEAQPPDLILTSTLITPRDERQLVTHLRQTSALRHLPVLTIPPVAEARESEARGFLARFRRRRPAAIEPLYDFGVIAVRIEEAIAQSKIAIADSDDDRPQVVVDLPAVVEPAMSETAISVSYDVFKPRERAMRWAGWELPWLSSVKVPWGIDLRLINISRTGLLVESRARISPGATTTFRLWGPGRDVTIPARIVRSDVASVDRFGVKYHAAAVFDQVIDTMMPEPSVPVDVDSHFTALVDAIRAKAMAGANPTQLRAEFEAGVMQMVTARDVRLRDVPVAENDGRESVYFRVGTPEEPAVLQVTFEANYQPRLEEFAALKAAALAASFVVDVTDTARQVKLPMLKAAALVNAPLRLIPPASESTLELRPTA